MAMYVLVVGGGKVGSHLAKLLLAEGYRVKVIEKDAAKIERLKQELSPDSVIHGTGSDINILDQAGIRTAHVVTAVTGDDEVNLTITNLARFEFQVPRVIARVNNPKNSWMYTPEMGVDVAVNQADLIAHLIAEEMSLGDMMTLLKLRKGKYSLVEEKVSPGSKVVNKYLKDVTLPKECVVAAIIRQGSLVIPRGDTVFEPADEVLAVVHVNQLAQLAALLSDSE